MLSDPGAVTFSLSASPSHSLSHSLLLCCTFAVPLLFLSSLSRFNFLYPCTSLFVQLNGSRSMALRLSSPNRVPMLLFLALPVALYFPLSVSSSRFPVPACFSASHFSFPLPFRFNLMCPFRCPRPCDVLRIRTPVPAPACSLRFSVSWYINNFHRLHSPSL